MKFSDFFRNSGHFYVIYQSQLTEEVFQFGFVTLSVYQTVNLNGLAHPSRRHLKEILYTFFELTALYSEVWMNVFLRHLQKISESHYKTVSAAVCALETVTFSKSKAFIKLQKMHARGDSPIQATQVCAAPKGMVFEPFWSEIGYRFQGYNDSV